MKKITSTLLLLVFALVATVQAQDETTITIIKSDTTVVTTDIVHAEEARIVDQQVLPNSGYYKLSHSKRKLNNNKWTWDAGTYAGVNLLYSGLVQNLGALSLPSDASYMSLSPKSIGIDINVIDFVVYSYRRFGIVTGLGFEINNFRFENNISLRLDAQGQVAPDYSYEDQGIKLSKSKLTTTYLNIPLLAQLKFGGSSYRNYRGYISAGIVGGLRLQTYTKVKSCEQGKSRNHSSLNMTNFHYGAQVSIGYSGFSLTAKYYPKSVFRSGYGPNLSQVNLGIGFMF